MEFHSFESWRSSPWREDFQNLAEAFLLWYHLGTFRMDQVLLSYTQLSLGKCTSSLYSVNPTGLFTNQESFVQFSDSLLHRRGWWPAECEVPSPLFSNFSQLLWTGFSQPTVVFCICVQLATEVSIPRSHLKWQSSQTTRSSWHKFGDAMWRWCRISGRF